MQTWIMKELYWWEESIKFLSKWSNNINFILMEELQIISWVLGGNDDENQLEHKYYSRQSPYSNGEWNNVTQLKSGNRAIIYLLTHLFILRGPYIGSDLTFLVSL